MKRSALIRRLLPVFLAKFFRNLVFWYGIEKLFMTTIGYNDVTIGMMAAVYSAISILADAPSGILADRWSRKGVIVLATISLGLSGVTGWLAHDVTSFLISAVLWGLFDAFASSTDSSQLYDILLEEQGHADNFQKILGRYEAVGGVALILGSIIGGYIGQYLGLREAFLWSVVPALVAIVLTLTIKDSQVQHEQEDEHLWRHIKGTLKAVFRNKNLTWLLVSLLALAQVNNIIGEMHQLWYLAIGAEASFYGLASGIVISTYGIGGLITGVFQSQKRVLVAILIVLAASMASAFTHNQYLIVLAQFLIGFFTYTLGLVFSAQINHQLPSRYRAGASSAINSVSRLLFIPIVLGFGAVSHTINVFTAAFILVALSLVGLYSELHSHFTRTKV